MKNNINFNKLKEIREAAKHFDMSDEELASTMLQQGHINLSELFAFLNLEDIEYFKTMNSEVKVTVEQLRADLANGYTRFNSGKGYDPIKKNSIMDKYGVSRKDVTEVFKNSALKGKKTIIPTTPRFVLVPQNEPVEAAKSFTENDSTIN